MSGFRYFDILIIAETKIDETFPTNQFLIDGYMPPLRADRNRHGGGLLIHIKEGVPAKEVSTSGLISKEIEIKVVEINLHKIKWLLIGIYRPPSQSEKFFFEEISKNMEHYFTNYENFLVVGDFNLGEENSTLKDFMNSCHLENVVKKPTCFKSDSPTCIDLILTEVVVAPWCNPLTLQPEQSGGVGSSPGRAPPLERHDKGSRTRLGLLYFCDPSAWR